MKKSTVQKRGFVFFVFILCLSLTACTTPTDPGTQPPPGVDTGSLQVTVVGLLTDVEAAVEVTGPENYSQTVKRSQTLQLPTGTYSLSIESVTAAGVTYAAELDKESVDVAVSQTVTVTATYTLVGQVGPNEIAPGVTRTGQVPEGALKDYTVKGVENVPLLFDFEGTDEVAGIAQYQVEFYRADDTVTPLSSDTHNTNDALLDPVVAFVPPADGDYLLRVRGVSGTVIYQVTGAYLSGSPEERAARRDLELGDQVRGGVALDSFDVYRFAGTADTSVVFDFTDTSRLPQNGGVFRVAFYAVGGEEALFTSASFMAGGKHQVGFTPTANGDYEARVVGLNGALTYAFTFRGLE